MRRPFSDTHLAKLEKMLKQVEEKYEPEIYQEISRLTRKTYFRSYDIHFAGEIEEMHGNGRLGRYQIESMLSPYVHKLLDLVKENGPDDDIHKSTIAEMLMVFSISAGCSEALKQRARNGDAAAVEFLEKYGLIFKPYSPFNSEF